MQSTLRPSLQSPKVSAPRTHLTASSRTRFCVRAASVEAEAFEVTLDKPLGLKFGRGNDGGAYVLATDPNVGETDERIQPGDKIIKVSASFGNDVWDALNYGQVMYAIKTRAGGVYFQIEPRGGDMSPLEPEEMTAGEAMFANERAGGNYGAGTKEVQVKNYVARKESERKRREQFDDALSLFKSGKIEEALIEFENVLSTEPRNYLGDDFSRVTQIFRVSQYNVACCYAAVDAVDAGLEALDEALNSGFDDYKKVRTDKNLAALRESPKFKGVIDKYDEPLINEGAINAIKNIFSFGKNKDDDDL